MQAFLVAKSMCFFHSKNGITKAKDGSGTLSWFSFYLFPGK